VLLNKGAGEIWLLGLNMTSGRLSYKYEFYLNSAGGTAFQGAFVNLYRYYIPTVGNYFEQNLGSAPQSNVTFNPARQHGLIFSSLQTYACYQKKSYPR